MTLGGGLRPSEVGQGHPRYWSGVDRVHSKVGALIHAMHGTCHEPNIQL